MNGLNIYAIGLILGGLAIFIYGINLMSDALKSIAGTKIRDYIAKYTSNLLMSIIVGIVISALLHSSSEVTVISISLVRAGLMSLMQAIGITIGTNVGTCMTALIAAAGGSVPTKRAAWFHAVYNLFGALLGMVLLTPFVNLTNYITQLLNGSGEMYIAQAHLIFNIISTILIIPFVKQSVKLLEKIIPDETNKDLKIENIDNLNDSLIERFPVVALAIAKKILFEWEEIY